jgi:catechol 2,3-dioxygenase-like lactoylglutathione lyase family enzyme
MMQIEELARLNYDIDPEGVTTMSDDFKAEVQLAANHTAIRVANLEGALDFYSGLLGLPVTRVRGPKDNPDSVWLPGLQIVVDPDVKPGSNLDHSALGIMNIDEACKRLDDAGYVAATPLTEVQPDDQGGRHLKMAFYHDPEGNKVEILCYLD